MSIQMVNVILDAELDRIHQKMNKGNDWELQEVETNLRKLIIQENISVFDLILVEDKP